MTRKRGNPAKADRNVKGVSFHEFKAQTKNQEHFVWSVAENDVIIGTGPAGVGKTFLSVGLACQYLLYGKCNRILVTKSILSCDGDLGAFPGDVSEKIAPYMLPYLDYFHFFIGPDKTEQMIHYGNLLLYPVELIRGHTYNNTIMIADEIQNMTTKQIKLFLTRMGQKSKAILIGDPKQSDIPKSGMDFCLQYLHDLPGLEICEFDRSDILRHPIIPEILDRFEKHG